MKSYDQRGYLGTELVIPIGNDLTENSDGNPMCGVQLLSSQERFCKVIEGWAKHKEIGRIGTLVVGDEGTGIDVSIRINLDPRVEGNSEDITLVRFALPYTSLVHLSIALRGLVEHYDLIREGGFED